MNIFNCHLQPQCARILQASTTPFTRIFWQIANCLAGQAYPIFSCKVTLGTANVCLHVCMSCLYVWALLLLHILPTLPALLFSDVATSHYNITHITCITGCPQFFYSLWALLYYIYYPHYQLSSSQTLQRHITILHILHILLTVLFFLTYIFNK